jgi:hypothetical protein
MTGQRLGFHESAALSVDLLTGGQFMNCQKAWWNLVSRNTRGWAND